MGLFDGIGGMFGSGDHSSVLGAIGGKFQKWTDPIAMIPGVGDKWVDLTSNKIPGMVNKVGSKIITPFDKVDETINPVRKIPIVDKIGDVVRDKPGDAAALAVGGYFAAPAIAGAAGGAGGGAGATGAGLGGTGAAGTAGIGGGALTAAPGLSVGGTTALGSTAGLSGTWGTVLGGGGAVSGVAPGLSTVGSQTTGDLSGMTGQWQPVGNTSTMNGLTQSVQNLNKQQQQSQQQQAQQNDYGERMLNQWLAQARASQMASALRTTPAVQGQQMQSGQLFNPVG